jgi:3-hydroxyacyl-[acyl-carrier-protein] dehydratase
MDETWHSVSYNQQDALAVEACAGAGSPWFSGHFPGDPILPGIAILAMVRDAIIHHESERDRKVRITGIKRVRFRQPVRPGEALTISLSLSLQETCISYQFKVSTNGKTACTGIVAAEPFHDDHQEHD